MTIRGLPQTIRPQGKIVWTAPPSTVGRSTKRLLTLWPDPELPTESYPGDDLFERSLFQLALFGQPRKKPLFLRVVNVSLIASSEFVTDIILKCVGLEEVTQHILRDQRDLTHGARLAMIWPGGMRTIYHSACHDPDRRIFQAVARPHQLAAVHKR